MKTASPSGEKVRAYLAWIADPESVRDEDELARLRDDLASEGDPLLRLEIAAAIVRAENPDIDKLRADFVGVLKDYAAEKNYTAEVFLELGVPRDDLREAGLVLPRRAAEPTPKKRLTVDDVARLAPRKPFSIRQLHDHTGASKMTVRKAVKKMLDDGAIASVGPDPAFSGPGRAPMLYGFIVD